MTSENEAFSLLMLKVTFGILFVTLYFCWYCDTP